MKAERLEMLLEQVIELSNLVTELKTKNECLEKENEFLKELLKKATL